MHPFVSKPEDSNKGINLCMNEGQTLVCGLWLLYREYLWPMAALQGILSSVAKYFWAKGDCFR